MVENRIDVVITQEQVDKVLGLFKEVEATLPGLIELTAEQCQAMPRYSEKDLIFVLKALAIAEQHPEILPPSFDLDEMRRDITALQCLDKVLIPGRRVLGILEDSRFAAARESLGHESNVLKRLKTHHALTGKLEDALAELTDHHARSKPVKADKPTRA
ncbi:MAG: hypothetical protein NTV43_17650 [Methylococcales bacterium]|nr:hypothetical protein [Methylococcales bacterium]